MSGADTRGRHSMPVGDLWGAGDAAGPGELASVPATGAGVAGPATRTLSVAGARRPAGGDVPARRSLVHGGLLLRGATGAPNLDYCKSGTAGPCLS